METQARSQDMGGKCKYVCSIFSPFRPLFLLFLGGQDPLMDGGQRPPPASSPHSYVPVETTRLTEGKKIALR